MPRGKAGLLTLAASAFAASLVLAGCGPKYTYPADTVPKSIERICYARGTPQRGAAALATVLYASGWKVADVEFYSF